MIKLVGNVVFREDGIVKGAIFCNEDRSLILFPKNLPIKSPKGEYYLLAHYEAFSPEGSMGFLSPTQAIRFLSEVVQDQVSMETDIEREERLSQSGHTSVEGDWLDRFFRDISRFNLTLDGQRAREALSKSDQSRYAKTGKGKQSQRKWRMSEGGQSYLQDKKTRRKELNQNFKAAQAWMDANPGRTFEDWLTVSGQ